MSERLKKHIREIPDFPKPGINFKDISTLLRDGKVFAEVVDELARVCDEEGLRPEACACPEARGFILGAALAYRLGVGFIPIRKPGKLPWTTTRAEYSLEYGVDSIEMHVDAVRTSQRILLVDDLLATGGTIAACAELIEKSQASVVGCAFLVELTFLEGRRQLPRYRTFSLVKY